MPVRVLERSRDAGVGAAAAIAQLRVERDLLRERVLEGVLGDGVERLLVDELGGLEDAERLAELEPRKVRDGFEDRLRELVADHRRSLQHALVPLHQAIDARREQRVHGGRDLERLDRRDQSIGAAGALEVAGLDQTAHGLLGEEGVAARAIVHGLGHAGEARSLPSRPLISSRIASSPSGASGSWRYHDFCIHAALYSGPEVHDQQAGAAGNGVDPLLDPGLAGRVEPVEVLDEGHGRVVHGRPLHEAAQHAEERALPLLGRHRGGRVVLVRHAQQLEEQRQHFAVALVEEQHAARDLLARECAPDRCASIP